MNEPRDQEEAVRLIVEAGKSQSDSLSLRGLDLPRVPYEIASLAGHLNSLDLSYCPALADLSPLEKLTSLNSLGLVDLPELSDLSPLEKLTSLNSLDLSFCLALSDLRALQKLTSLNCP